MKQTTKDDHVRALGQQPDAENPVRRTRLPWIVLAVGLCISMQTWRLLDRWEVVCRPRPQSMTDQASWLPLIAGAVTLVATLLIVCCLRRLVRRHDENQKAHSERKQSVEKLRKNEEFLRGLLEQSPIPMLIETGTHEVVFLSRSFTKLFGYTEDDVRGFNDWWNLAFPDDEYRDEVVKRWFEGVQRSLLDRAEPEPMVADVTCKDNSIRHIEFSFSSYGDRTLVAFNDLTDRLERQEALRRAKDEAERTNRAKSQFLATMSHELRTPLNGVIGMTELLRSTALDEQQRSFVKVCHNSADSLLSLINDILDFSRIEAGKLDLHEDEFDLGCLVEDAAELLAPSAHERGLELLCSIDTRARIRVGGDRGRLRQVLVNLISNAVKFTDEGEVLIQARVRRSYGEHVVVRFSVTDTGIGIAEDNVDRLFDPFVQADGSNTRKYGGAGLGLAISKKLAELMDGQIGLESKVGCGSTFWLEVRLQQMDEREGQGPGGDERLCGHQVLIVDDNDCSRQILTDQLIAWGMSTETAESVDEAMEIIDRADSMDRCFQIIVADSSMPDRDGCDLAESLAHREDLPVVLLSAFDTMLDVEYQRQLGIAYCLAKPVKQSDLLEALTSVLFGDTRSQGVSAERDRSASSSARTSKKEQPLENVRILLVEDNDTSRMYATRLLEDSGAEYDAVVNGQLAVSAVRENRYDLILMDCQMPVMDGLEATRRIRRLELEGKLEGRVPIVAFTASAVKGDRNGCLEAGMDDHIRKPVSSRELLAMINRHLGDRCMATADDVPIPANEDARLTGGAEGASPIETEVLHERCMGNVEFAESLLKEFAQTGIERVEQISHHALEGDADTVAEIAHSLKGAAAIIAAEDMRAVAAELEATGRSGDLTDALEAVSRLRAEMTRCAEYIQDSERQPADPPTSETLELQIEE